MRIRGGTNGLLSAIDAGLIDPENAAIPEEAPRLKKLTGSDLRRQLNQERDSNRKFAKKCKRHNSSPY